MASIINRPGGHKWIQFMGLDGKRKTLRFGEISKKIAAEYCRRVELILEARRGGMAIEAETARWINDLPDKTYSKLFKVQLVHKREAAQAPTLELLLDSYVQHRADVKDSTSTVYGHTVRCLKTFFKPNRRIDTITIVDADAWRNWLATEANIRGRVGEGLSENTLRRRCGLAKQFFRHAVRAGMIKENPFRELKGQTRGNAARQFFVTYEMFEKVIAAAPSTEWRLIIALGRLGGLRIPSEMFTLKWSDVNLAEGRMVVRAPKTEHHAGGGVRMVPIFPELRPFLEDADAIAKPGAVYVIDRNRVRTMVRKRFRMIIERAGMTPWPRLWQNCRASRVTELLQGTPIQVVSTIMGHKAAVSLEHYAQTTDAHFQSLVSTATTTGAAKSEAQAKQNAKLNTAEPNVTERQETKKAPNNQGFLAVHSGSFSSVHDPLLGGTGLEPVTSTV